MRLVLVSCCCSSWLILIDGILRIFFYDVVMVAMIVRVVFIMIIGTLFYIDALLSIDA